MVIQGQTIGLAGLQLIMLFTETTSFGDEYL
jgi:hypothetical protein